jgi:hypothetical protein
MAAWDEPATAVTPRGWLRDSLGRALGWYLDYGTGYRAHRRHEEYGGTFCDPSHEQYAPCYRCEPGDILACAGSRVRWVETAEQARAFVRDAQTAVAA